MNKLQLLLSELIAFPSITPDDKGCQAYLVTKLQALGFDCQSFDNPPVSNFFAVYGHEGPLFVFAGHTDVVSPGDLSQWQSDPFVLTESEGLLFGRGCADMKGSLAAMVMAAKRFIDNHPDFPGRLGFLITSGEEGDHFHLGTPYVMEQLKKQGICPDFCVIGEPSSEKTIADSIKVGRRGSATLKVTLQGKQGHVAYPHLAKNPIHCLSPVLFDLIRIEWDKGNDYFPPTSLQITQIQSGGQGNNIIPGELTLHLNIRYSTEQTFKGLQHTLAECFNRHELTPMLTWQLNGEPFLTESGELIQATIAAIQKETQHPPTLSTQGGTSDGRFIAPYGVQVIELGPQNATIHQVNECVRLSDLEALSRIYENLCEQLFFH